MNEVVPGNDKLSVTAFCALALVLLTAIGGLAGYIDNYFTESVAQYMANDLRRKIYHHLQNFHSLITIHTRWQNC